MKIFIIFLAGFIYVTEASADVRLPKIFGENMVLQRNHLIPVWGWADPGEKVSVQFDKQNKTAKADKKGHWIVNLDSQGEGGPFQLLVKGKNTITINNILVGDVWICSGQSNMEFEVNGSINAQVEMQEANYPQIRHFQVPKKVSASAKEDLDDGDWVITSPETVGNFTAVGYFFARELYKQMKVPIGLIHTSWGGTHVETWTSRKAFEESNEFKDMIASMPSLNLDSLAKEKTAATLKKIEALQGPVNNAGDLEEWKNISFDDSKWAKMSLPSLWEEKGLDELDGIVWFRKIIMVSAGDVGKAAILELGPIDDSDDSYVNGIKVGSTKNRYNENRRYVVPPGILKEGRNVIAVRVEDTGGGGGIYGEPEQLKLTIDQKAMPLNGDWSFRIETLIQGSSSISPNSYPTLLFNAMINPLIPYAIKGAIWYQGESNAGRAYQYRTAFPLMITDWRKHWGYDFPFLFVQLANYKAGDENGSKGSSWAELREAQTMTLSLPHTGMAVITDIGEPNDIHPKNKQDVGKRLAAIALNNVYGQTNPFSGPVFHSIETDGNKIILTFDQVGSGLMIKDKYGYLKGFEIAGEDRKFQYAKASIENNKVIVYQETIKNPVAVRYAWADNPEDANLYNKEGFPAGAFRTDKWKSNTENEKFTISKQ